MVLDADRISLFAVRAVLRDWIVLDADRISLFALCSRTG